LFQDGPEGRSGTGVGDESKGQILCYPARSGRTKAPTPLTEHVSHLKGIPRKDYLQIPFDTPDVTFRSGQHGPLECNPTPDVVNQLLMAGPLVVLYEISILAVRFFGRTILSEHKEE
jgi:hypothetical protein